MVCNNQFLLARFMEKRASLEWPADAQPIPIPQTLVEAAAAAEQVHQLARGKPEQRQGFRQQPPPMKVLCLFPPDSKTPYSSSMTDFLLCLCLFPSDNPSSITEFFFYLCLFPPDNKTPYPSSMTESLLCLWFVSLSFSS